MPQMSKILHSRNEWKEKAIQRANELREQKKTQKRHLQKIAELKAHLKAAEACDSEKNKQTTVKPIPLVEAQETRTLCVLLVTQAIVSYRSVPKILRLFNEQTPLQLNWIPHFSSVINWSLRLGLGLLNQVKPIVQPWLAIVDHSIDVGTKKALVVLRVRLDTLSKKEGALQLSDCECIGLRVSETVNGNTIAADLGDIFAQAGAPVGVIKDCEATLNKGVKLWSQSHAPELEIIDDVSHVMATALKKQYEAADAYKQFIALTTGAANKLRQTALAFLIPPKLRKKGRFLSISRLGEWGSKMLEVLSTKNKSDEEMLQKLNTALPDFEQTSPFIEDFSKTTHIISQTMQVLKIQGLEPKTYEHCKSLSAQLPDDTEVKRNLDAWLDKHLEVQKRISATVPLAVSSDIIESLFGSFKHVIERSPQSDMNRSALIIPTLCGNVNAATVNMALSHARHTDLDAWEKENIPYTMRKKRREIFQNIKPKIGENTS